jgi:hypothetical protein
VREINRFNQPAIGNPGNGSYKNEELKKGQSNELDSILSPKVAS